MTYDILSTGSIGNAVVINGEILIDCGVPMKKLRESGYIKSLKLVLLTHAHGDHFNAATVRALHRERPALRWGCCEWMKWEDCEKKIPGPLLEAKVDERVIDVLSAGYEIGYKPDRSIGSDAVVATIRPEPLVHDVPNCGWHILTENERLFYATDTSTLDHIEAKDYDLYLIESNHTKAEIEARIADKQSRGEFAYEVRAARNHLSQEQALDWLARNAGPNSKYVFLHQHMEKEKKDG